MFGGKKKQKRSVSATRPVQTNRVFSYYNSGSNAKRATESQPKIQRARGKLTWVKHLPTYIASVLIVGSIGYSMTLSSTPNVIIDSINDKNRSTLRSQSVYQEAVQKTLKSSIWSKSKLTVDTASIEQQIMQQFPELHGVSVKVPLVSRKPVVVLEPSTATVVLTPKDGLPYVLDEDGRAILMAQQFNQKQAGIINVLDESGVDISLGKQIVPGSTIDFITTLKSELSSRGVYIESMTLPAIANQLNIKPAGQKYLVKFNLEGDVREQAGAYLAVFRKLKARGALPSSYIDVRVDERVYYK